MKVGSPSQVGSPSRIRFRGMLSSSSDEEVGDAERKDTQSLAGTAATSTNSWDVGDVEWKNTQSTAGTAGTSTKSLSPQPVRRTSDTRSPSFARSPSGATSSRSAVRTPLPSSAPERTTPSRGLPPRDPITGKRLWPKFGGYASIVVPAAADEEGASSSASSVVSATSLPRDTVEDARHERFAPGPSCLPALDQTGPHAEIPAALDRKRSTCVLPTLAALCCSDLNTPHPSNAWSACQYPRS